MNDYNTAVIRACGKCIEHYGIKEIRRYFKQKECE